VAQAASKLKHWRETQEHWNDDAFLAVTANAFMKLRWKRLNREAAAEAGRLSRRLGRAIDLVDVGCAHADFFGYARASLRGYTGVEPSKALLPKNVAKGKAFKLVRGQAEKLPLKDSSADFVLVKEVLDHCYDPLKVVAEARRVLRPGGLLVITLTNDHAWYKRLLPSLARRIKSGQHDHLYFFHPDQVVRLARQAGFTEISERSSHYLRLPGRLESALGSLPEFVGAALITATDAVGSLAGPGYGGSFWVVAEK
jgi:ubiquinone/menaquinone biosynthesis C-methylase UbiE